jgi:hypothetical protein
MMFDHGGRHVVGPNRWRGSVLQRDPESPDDASAIDSVHATTSAFVITVT